MNCLYCHKEISDKAKYCSEAHRKAYTRRTKAGDTPDKNDPNNPDKSTRTFSFKLTRTDRLFENSDPGYYNFSKTLYTRKCFICDQEFKTHLQLLKTCSPKHKDELLNSLRV